MKCFWGIGSHGRVSVRVGAEARAPGAPVRSYGWMEGPGASLLHLEGGQPAPLPDHHPFHGRRFNARTELYRGAPHHIPVSLRHPSVWWASAAASPVP